MPVRDLFAYLQEKGLVQSSPLDELRGQRVGVEGRAWLRRHARCTDSYHVAMGGPPLTLLTQVDSHLDALRDAGITPFFVWEGLAPVANRSDVQARFAEDYSSQKRQSAWTLYYREQQEAANKAFVTSEKHGVDQFAGLVVRQLAQRRVESFRAPMRSWPQLAWFSSHHRPAFCAWVHGTDELLLFGCEQVIVEWRPGTAAAKDDSDGGPVFRWVRLSAVLQELQLNQDQFVDACILAGFEYSQTFPGVQASRIPNKFQAAVDLVRAHQTGYQAVQAAPAGDAYLESYFLPARALVRHLPIMEPPCRVRSLLAHHVPRQLKAVLGPRLPADLYYLLSTGVLDPDVVGPLTSGLVLEHAPMVDSDEYRRLVAVLMGARARTLAQVAACLHPEFQRSPVDTLAWHVADQKFTRMDRAPVVRPGQLPRIARTTERIHALRKQFAANGSAAGGESREVGAMIRVTLELIRIQQDHDAASKAGAAAAGRPAAAATAADDDEGFQACWVGVGSDSIPFKSDADTHAAVMARFLGGAGYIDLDGWACTAWGRALALGSARFSEPHMALLELARHHLLSGAEFSFQPPLGSTGGAGGGPPAHGDEELHLLARVLSAVPVRLAADQEWVGPLDHDLMAFNCLLRAVYRSLRLACQAELVGAVIPRLAMVRPQRLATLTAAMPFVREASTAMGVVVKRLLLAATAVAAPELKELFVNCTSLERDLAEAVQFWREFQQMVASLVKDGVDLGPSLPAQVERAHTLLMKQIKKWKL